MPDLTNAHSIDVICRTAQILPPRDILIDAHGKYLLYQGVRVSFAEGAESEAAEDETAINDANAIKGAIQGYSRDVQDPISRADVAKMERGMQGHCQQNGGRWRRPGVRQQKPGGGHRVLGGTHSSSYSQKR